MHKKSNALEIIPGIGVGPYKLGDAVQKIKEQTTILSEEVTGPHTTVLQAKNISFYIQNDQVTQIMLREESQSRYRGIQLIEKTLAEIEAQLGVTIIVDDEDNLVIQGVDGMCFDNPFLQDVGFGQKDYGSYKIKEVYVF